MVSGLSSCTRTPSQHFPHTATPTSRLRFSCSYGNRRHDWSKTTVMSGWGRGHGHAPSWRTKALCSQAGEEVRPKQLEDISACQSPRLVPCTLIKRTTSDATRRPSPSVWWDQSISRSSGRLIKDTCLMKIQIEAEALSEAWDRDQMRSSFQLGRFRNEGYAY